MEKFLKLNYLDGIGEKGTVDLTRNWFNQNLSSFNRNDTKKIFSKKKNHYCIQSVVNLKPRRTVLNKLKTKKIWRTKMRRINVFVTIMSNVSSVDLFGKLIQISKMTDKEEKAENGVYKLDQKALRQQQRQEF